MASIDGNYQISNNNHTTINKMAANLQHKTSKLSQ